MLADTLREVAGTRLVDEDGNEEVLELLPPATELEIEGVEAQIAVPLPTELREALRVSAGFANGPLESLGFLDLAGFGMEDVFPDAYPLGHDGFGNYWVLDLLPDGDECGPVFFACHDPPVVAFQSNGPGEFVREVVALWQPEARSPVDIVHEDVTSSIWASRAELPTRETVLASDDPVLSEFAAGFPPEAVFADLRAPKVGDGFPWGRYGPRTEWTRAGRLRVWATVPPPPRRGLLGRLFGRRGFGWLLAAALLPPTATAAQVVDDPAEVIRRNRVAQNEAIAAGDFEAVSSYWVDDIVVTAGLGFVLAGKESYRQAFEAEGALTYERTPESVEVSNDWPIALESGRWEGRDASGTRLISGRYSAQWVGEEGIWQIRAELFVATGCAGRACDWPVGMRPDSAGPH